MLFPGLARASPPLWRALSFTRLLAMPRIVPSMYPSESDGIRRIPLAKLIGFSQRLDESVGP